MGLPDITLQTITFRVVALLIMVAVHGFIVSGTAMLLGDKGPKYDGRLTAVPTAHVDFVGAISLIFFGLGWTKPVAVDAGQFRIGKIGIVGVILAGFVALLALAVFLAAMAIPALTSLPFTAGLSTSLFLRVASSLAIWFALLSLIPIPPLTGGLLWGAFGIRVSRKLDWSLAAGVLLIVASGMVHQVLGPVHAFLTSVIIGV